MTKLTTKKEIRTDKKRTKNFDKKSFRYLAARGYFNFLSDEVYLRTKYWACTGRKLNLKNPTRFNEKLQWLKIYERKNSLYNQKDSK